MIDLDLKPLFYDPTLGSAIHRELRDDMNLEFSIEDKCIYNLTKYLGTRKVFDPRTGNDVEEEVEKVDKELVVRMKESSRYADYSRIQCPLVIGGLSVDSVISAGVVSQFLTDSLLSVDRQLAENILFDNFYDVDVVTDCLCNVAMFNNPSGEVIPFELSVDSSKIEVVKVVVGEEVVVPEIIEGLDWAEEPMDEVETNVRRGRGKVDQLITRVKKEPILSTFKGVVWMLMRSGLLDDIETVDPNNEEEMMMRKELLTGTVMNVLEENKGGAGDLLRQACLEAGLFSRSLVKEQFDLLNEMASQEGSGVKKSGGKITNFGKLVGEEREYSYGIELIKDAMETELDL